MKNFLRGMVSILASIIVGIAMAYNIKTGSYVWASIDFILLVINLFLGVLNIVVGVYILRR